VGRSSTATDARVPIGAHGPRESGDETESILANGGPTLVGDLLSDAIERIWP
jgi:hypothetical protein